MAPTGPFPKGYGGRRKRGADRLAGGEGRDRPGIDLEGDFRQSVEYYPKPNVKKQVVYFLGHARNDHVVRQEEEIGETRWIPLEQAHTWVTFRNDKNLISKAKKILLPE